MLTKARLAHGMTQRDLAAHIGVHPVTVSQWERGDRAPSSNNISKLAKALSIDEGSLYLWCKHENRRRARVS